MISKYFVFLLTIPQIIGASLNREADFSYQPKEEIRSVVREKRGKQTFRNLKDDELPVFGFGFIPSESCCNSNNPNFLNRTNLNNYKAAGFNLAMGVNEIQNLNTRQLRRALDACEEAGIGYLVRDPMIFGKRSLVPIEEPAPTVQEYEDYIKDLWVTEHPGFSGFNFVDEPTCYNYSRIGNAQKAIDNTLENTLNLTTLFPSYGRQYFGIEDDSLSDWEAYEQYVQRFIDECNPQILCYDYYMFYMEENSRLTNQNTVNYYKSLSYFKKKSLEIGVPFWTSFSSIKHGCGKPHTAKELKWTVNTSLAYGSQGLEYYTYWPILEMADVYNLSNRNYSALTTPNGVLTDTYFIVKDINTFAHSVEDIIMNATHLGMLQFGNRLGSVIPEEDNLKYCLPLQNIKCENALVGCFDNSGKKAYYLVNDSIESGIESFEVIFDSKVNVRVRRLNSVQNYENISSLREFLSAGEACVIEVL